MKWFFVESVGYKMCETGKRYNYVSLMYTKLRTGFQVKKIKGKYIRGQCFLVKNEKYEVDKLYKG